MIPTWLTPWLVLLVIWVGVISFFIYEYVDRPFYDVSLFSPAYSFPGQAANDPDALTLQQVKWLSEQDLEEVEVTDTIDALQGNIPSSLLEQSAYLSGNTHAFPIRDQGACGSCFAFASIGAMEERVLIASGGLYDDKLSEQYFLSCVLDGFTCVSNSISGTLRDLSLYGVQAVNFTYQEKDNGNYQPVVPCETSLRASYTVYMSDVIHLKASSSEETVRIIKEELLVRGPVIAALEIFYDPATSYYYWRRYQVLDLSQVSEKRSAGWHMVIIKGWGTTPEGIPYWIIKNSWGPEGGTSPSDYYMVRMGTNESGIEEHVYAFQVHVLDEERQEIYFERAPGYVYRLHQRIQSDAQHSTYMYSAAVQLSIMLTAFLLQVEWTTQRRTLFIALIVMINIFTVVEVEWNVLHRQYQR
jgi:hypothetical protein